MDLHHLHLEKKQIQLVIWTILQCDKSSKESLKVTHIVPYLLITGNMYCCSPEQDRGLEALSHALRRQKDMGKAIGNEVDYQTGECGDVIEPNLTQLYRVLRIN